LAFSVYGRDAEAHAVKIRSRISCPDEGLARTLPSASDVDADALGSHLIEIAVVTAQPLRQRSRALDGESVSIVRNSA